MIIGVVSDTHADKVNALSHIMAEFKKRNVDVIVHCGDIEGKHVKSDLFLGLPVICALNPEQEEKPDFQNPPKNWTFTKSSKRVIDHGHIRMYVGHKRSFDFLNGTEIEMTKILNEARKVYDGLRLYFSGHTHHQIYLETPTVKFINPGAVEGGFDGYEFAVIDTEIPQIVFSRILQSKPAITDFSIGIISDSLNVSITNPGFWKGLAEELKKRNAMTIIHCGNINPADIGRQELKDFTVYYNLRVDQKNPVNVPENWHQIPLVSVEPPVVCINGYLFYVQLDLGMDLLEKTEMGMSMLSLEKRREYPEISYILCGFTHNALFVEGSEIKIINPGDVIRDRNFVVLCLPRGEVTYGHVPTDPLPEIT